MHVLLITQYWAPEEGVAQRRWTWLTGDFVKQGHSLSVVTPPPHYPGGKLTSTLPQHQPGAVERANPQVTVYRTRFREHDKSLTSRVKDQAVTMVSQVFIGRRILSEAKAEGRPVDAIQCTVPAIPSAIVAFLLARIHRLPLVIELRDAWPEILDYIDQWTEPLHGAVPATVKIKQRMFHRLLVEGGRVFNHVLKRSDLLITTTATLAELERDKGISNVVSVRNRANSGVPNCNVYPARGFGPLRVLYAGTVGRAQGLGSAIQAAKLAQDAGADIEFRIIGGGAHLEAVRQLAQEYGISVDFLPRIPFDQIADHYRWADTVLVHLEAWTPMEHTIPSKLFEIMWAEKHVSAAVAGEAAQIVASSRIGDVVQPMNPQALAHLWEELYRDRSRVNVDGRGHVWFRSGPNLETLTNRWMDAVDATIAQHRKNRRTA